MNETTRRSHVHADVDGKWTVVHDLDTSNLSTARDRYGMYQRKHGHLFPELRLVRTIVTTKVMNP